MFAKFEYKSVPLKDIFLDDRNPRIVTQKKLKTQKEIAEYLYEYEELEAFIRKIVSEGKNIGAERPYIVKSSSGYTVVEGNTRIASYKILTGLLEAPKGCTVPQISKSLKSSLAFVDCSIAPNRDALLPIMANAHFGLGDKSKWGYLGSRKAVYDEWKSGKSATQLAKAFDRTKGQINDLIIEYEVYLKALALKWTSQEKAILLNPAVEFNPPVRFLQTSGHKALVGISYDKANLKVNLADSEATKKFQHLIQKLVINPTKGLGATASYEDVFRDFGRGSGKKGTGKTGRTNASNGQSGGTKSKSKTNSARVKPTALFGYSVTLNNALIDRLMDEAKSLDCRKFAASGTFLLRNIVESILKQIIHDQKANPASRLLDLEGAINLCMSTHVSLPPDDKKILKEFLKSHVSYLNLGAHGTVIPNFDRLTAARDCVDQFIKRNV